METITCVCVVGVPRRCLRYANAHACLLMCVTSTFSWQNTGIVLKCAHFAGISEARARENWRRKHAHTRCSLSTDANFRCTRFTAPHSRQCECVCMCACASWSSCSHAIMRTHFVERLFIIFNIHRRRLRRRHTHTHTCIYIWFL